MKSTKTRFFVIFVTIYVVAALCWWAYLLYDKTEEAYKGQVGILKKELEEKGVKEADFYTSKEFLKMRKKYRLQSQMILGEAIVFLFILMGGIWVVTRGLRREVALARQQRNFLLSITHELKSPLAGIRLVLETFIKRNLTKEQLTKLSNNGLQDVDRLSQLVDNLLMAAKVENEYEWFREFVDLKEMIQELLVGLRQKYPEFSFEEKLADNIQPVKMDRAGVTSVILNLVENAVKYAGEKKEITLSLSQKRFRIFFEVADCGLGIADEEKEKVFEKFYRVGNEDRRKTKGTGLGLFIVREIVRAHNGQIFVKDNKPEGTKFIIWLPKKRTFEQGSSTFFWE